MSLISLEAVRERKIQLLERARKATCSIYNTVSSSKLSKFCVHCKFQNTEHCPKQGQTVGLTTEVLPFRQKQSFLA